MAKQTSDITLSGKLGDHVHYSRGGKHFTKRASAKPYNFSPGSIAAQQAFGLGSQTGKQLKTALKTVLAEYKYEGVHNRLTEVCKRIFRNGPVHELESKNFIDHNIKMLLGLNLNKHAAINSLILQNPIILGYDPSGQVKLTIAEHNPMTAFSNLLKMHAISIRFLFSVIDLEASSFNHHQTKDIIIPLYQSHFTKLQGTFQVAPLNNKLFICCTQVRYYGNADYSSYSNNKKLVAAAITAVEYARDDMFVSYPPLDQQTTKAATTDSSPINVIDIKWE
ncbi:hypothetical protein [Olivibacter sp. XZL3]|uniref:hypothetical protein n=1 Tax=Olivibacter sp. XZL3 TaxID=1735116 RepID=UPI001066DAA7|nr:hypothetical protein [Olivibacter sp. XZL3]